jgi:hypothetical protein
MATYYVTKAAGGGGIGSEADPYTLAEAADNVSAGDKVYVKADGIYDTEDGSNDCVLHATTAGSAGSPIVWEGYHTTPGDGGIVTIDADPAGDQYAYGIYITQAQAYNVIKNFYIKGASSFGVRGFDYCTFKNCRSSNNGGDGFNTDDYTVFENCVSDNNTNIGFFGDLSCRAFGCISYSNSSIAFDFNGTNCVVAFCLCYAGNNDHEIELGNSGVAINCTIDGEGQNSNEGIYFVDVLNGISVVNCVLHDCSTGIAASSDIGERAVGRNNLFNSNDTDVSNFLAVSTGDGVGDRGDVSATAGFTNEANDDYSLSGSGSADAAGFDCKFVDDFWDSYNGGAGDNPPSP